MKTETSKEKKAREARAQKQIKQIGYASLANRKSPKEIENAILMSSGITWAICKLLDCTLNEWNVLLNTNKEYWNLWKATRKTLVARAEDTMVNLLDSPNEKTRFDASKYLLDRLGTSEGYGQQPQVAVGVQISPEDKKVEVKAIFGIEDQPAIDADVSK